MGCFIYPNLKDLSSPWKFDLQWCNFSISCQEKCWYTPPLKIKSLWNCNMSLDGENGRRWKHVIPWKMIFIMCVCVVFNHQIVVSMSCLADSSYRDWSTCQISGLEFEPKAWYMLSVMIWLKTLQLKPFILFSTDQMLFFFRLRSLLILC